MDRDSSRDEIALLAALTAKQKEVLDQLVQHKTSKEIARELGISPHTVDQRIQFAKSKLGAATRGELAQEYRRICSICDAMTYENSRIAETLEPAEIATMDGGAPEPPDLAEANDTSEAELGDASDTPVVPEIFEGPYGNLMRIGTILLLALIILILALGSMAVFTEASRILGR
ncbi:hypothetical protein SZ64_16590 [Erythrobacter sp. SG61-1L]|nr:hypothetical protein SZ64_16590 [Erythrobacter sp. SG61-1L]